MTQWYYTQHGQKFGPFDEARIHALVAARTVLPDTLVWREGLPGWQKASVAGLITPPSFSPSAVSGISLQKNAKAPWYYTLRGQKFGPYDDTQIRGLVAARTVLPDTLVWREGLPGWQKASAAGLVTPPVSAPARPAPQPAPEPKPAPQPAPAPESKPAQVPEPRPAPVSRPSPETQSTPEHEPEPMPAPQPAPEPQPEPPSTPPPQPASSSGATPPPFSGPPRSETPPAGGPPSFEPPPDSSSGDSFGAGEILTSAFKLAMPNIISIVLAFLFWILTIWIPYVNIGTTIAMATLPRKLAEGGIISPFSIFESRYRKYIGDFFIVNALMTPAILMATMFMIIPGIVLGLSWCLALPLAMEENTGATEALSRSNELMAGHKWSAFFAMLCVAVIQFGFTFTIGVLASRSDAYWLPALVFWLFSFPYVGITAALYRKLVLRQPL